LPNRYTLLLPQTLYQAMVEHALAALPNECCGLLGGILGPDRVRAVQRFPLVNSAASPKVEYLSEPRSMFAADRALRAAGLDVVAVYHSHPTSRPVPSKKDIAANYSETVINLIISLQGGQPEVRAWWLWDGGYDEGKWEFAEDDGVIPNTPPRKT
jgi:proteasome lid subunit RPN8/RPN11